MNSNNIEGRPRTEALDADAVCAQCNTVNAEGTLLCKVCGNNLRDQRAIRLAADQALDLERVGQRRKAWMSGLMFLMALGIVVATVLNQDLIVNWLINADGQAGSNPDAFWEGAYEARYAPMMQALTGAGVTEEMAIAAKSAPVAGATIDGIYALFVGETFAGIANAHLDGTELHFVAILTDDVEVRGWALQQGNYFAAQPENAAVLRGRRAGEARGVAMPRGNGVVECIGDFNNEQMSFDAFRLADN